MGFVLADKNNNNIRGLMGRHNMLKVMLFNCSTENIPMAPIMMPPFDFDIYNYTSNCIMLDFPRQRRSGLSCAHLINVFAAICKKIHCGACAFTTEHTGWPKK